MYQRWASPPKGKGIYLWSRQRDEWPQIPPDDRLYSWMVYPLSGRCWKTISEQIDYFFFITFSSNIYGHIALSWSLLKLVKGMFSSSDCDFIQKESKRLPPELITFCHWYMCIECYTEGWWMLWFSDWGVAWRSRKRAIFKIRQSCV